MTEAAARLTWRTGRGNLYFDKPRVMGILNVTPDSFFDGGRHSGTAAALHHAEVLLAEGADLIDVGGESTRPGAQPVAIAEESQRIVPVVRAIVRQWPEAIVSVDTVKSEVAAAAAAEGAAVINDVSGLRIDARIAEVVATNGLGLVLMHSRGTVSEMASYETARYGTDPVAEIVQELSDAAENALRRGVDVGQIVLDPGLGFSKRTEHSLAVLAQLERMIALGYPVMVGPSRKRFIGELSGGLPPAERLEGTLGAIVAARARGAVLFRVHDVRAARRALDVTDAILNS
ncbi:MAG: dihydropteroate synthase [Gemmatimonadota bacterium]